MSSLSKFKTLVTRTLLRSASLDFDTWFATISTRDSLPRSAIFTVCEWADLFWGDSKHQTIRLCPKLHGASHSLNVEGKCLSKYFYILIYWCIWMYMITLVIIGDMNPSESLNQLNHDSLIRTCIVRNTARWGHLLVRWIYNKQIQLPLSFYSFCFINLPNLRIIYRIQ